MFSEVYLSVLTAMLWRNKDVYYMLVWRAVNAVTDDTTILCAAMLINMLQWLRHDERLVQLDKTPRRVVN